MHLAIQDTFLLYGGLSRHSGAPINEFDNIRTFDTDTGFDLVDMWKISTWFRPPGAVWQEGWDPRLGWHASNWLIQHGLPRSLDMQLRFDNGHSMLLSTAITHRDWASTNQSRLYQRPRDAPHSLSGQTAGNQDHDTTVQETKSPVHHPRDLVHSVC